MRACVRKAKNFEQHLIGLTQKNQQRERYSIDSLINLPSCSAFCLLLSEIYDPDLIMFFFLLHNGFY